MAELRTKITLLNNMRLQQKSRMPMRSQAGSLQVRWIQKLLRNKILGCSLQKESCSRNVGFVQPLLFQETS